MQYKIVTDSSSNMFGLDGVGFASAPLKIITKEKEYVDTPDLDVAQMVADLAAYKGTSGSSCPNMMEWLEAFGDADCVFAISITSGLSGSYNAANQAAQDYMDSHPERKACVIDSLSAGPELRLIAEHIRDRIAAGKSFEEAEASVREYQKDTRTLFTLQSLNNLARNGRVSPAVAKIAGVLGICVVGKASEIGTLEQMHKCRGEKRSLETMYAEMKNMGYTGGKLRISHCLNERAAEQLKAMTLAEFPQADVGIEPCTALCSFYAEKGGLIIGFEGKRP